MSYSFSIRSKVLAGPDEILAALPDSRCRILEEVEAGERWQNGVYRHFYVDGASTRGVECGIDSGGLEVRILASANRPDFELARQIIRIAAGKDGEVESEEGEKVPADGLDTLLTETWIESQVESGARVVAAIVKKDQTVLTIPGLLREACFGPRLIAELEQGEPKGFAGRFLERLREIKFADTEGWFCASRMQTELEGKEKPTTFAVWAADVSYLFPNVSLLAIAAGEKDVFFVPRSVLDRLSPEPPQYLDEVQCFVKAVPESEWPSFVARARELGIPMPKRREPAPQKRRWKLW